MNCPKCQTEMTNGYSSANTPLSWVEAEKFESFAFTDKDLAHVGMKSLLPSAAQYFKSAHCPDCKVVTIDYSVKYSRKQAESIAAKNE